MGKREEAIEEDASVVGRGEAGGQRGAWEARGWRSGKERARFTRSSDVPAVGWALFRELDGEMGQQWEESRMDKGRGLSFRLPEIWVCL